MNVLRRKLSLLYLPRSKRGRWKWSNSIIMLWWRTFIFIFFHQWVSQKHNQRTIQTFKNMTYSPFSMGRKCRGLPKNDLITLGVQQGSGRDGWRGTSLWHLWSSGMCAVLEGTNIPFIRSGLQPLIMSLFCLQANLVLQSVKSVLEMLD